MRIRRPTRPLAHGLVAVLLTVAVACDQGAQEEPTADEDASGDADDDISADPEDEDGSLLALDAECRSQEQGYVVSYPEPWHVNDGEHLPSCTVFDPDPVEIEGGRDLPTDLAVTIRREDVPFGEVTELDSDAEREISAEDVKVAERDARMLEVEATGAGLYPEGLRTHRYYVDWGSDTLVAETHDAEGMEFAYEERRDLLDAMMDSLEPVDGG